MPYPMSFHIRYQYRSSDNGVIVPVLLSIGSASVKLAARVDTGAQNCLFQRDYAEALSIDVETGTRQGFSTAAGNFRAFGHQLTLEAVGVKVDALVYFYEDREKDRDVLGRTGWLDRIRFGLVHHDSLLYLSAYDE
jgi:hypothetical protein